MNEQVTQESSSEPVQKPKKKRSQAEQYGRHRWNQVLLKRGDKKLDQILDELRWIRNRLQAEGHNDYTKPMIEKFAVVDQVDLEIIERIRQAGAPGVLPKDVAKDPALSKYGLKYYDVSRRITRMNKRLQYETKEYLFEKRGHKWALTSFAFDVWGEVAEFLEKTHSS